jgi:hypothetical protein
MSQQDFKAMYGVQDGETKLNAKRRKSEAHMDVNSENAQWKDMYKYGADSPRGDHKQKVKSKSAPSKMLSSVFESSHSGSYSSSAEELKPQRKSIVAKALRFFTHK